MQKFLSGLLVGCLVTALVVYFAVVPHVRESSRAVGMNDGEIAARDEIARKILSSIGTDLIPDERILPIFEVKAITVVVVERNGVKTLRVMK